MIRGLDASSVQGKLPFDQLGEEYRFIILKAVQGNDGTDPWFERNALEALSRGLEVFAYCFPYPLPHLKPEEQAKRFVDFVGRVLPGRPLFLDYEWPEVVPSQAGKKGWREWGCNPRQLAAWMRACSAEVERLSGVRPALYTYDWWWACIRDGAPAYGFMESADVAWAADYPLWMAWYRQGWPTAGDKPKVPKPWADWTFWQFDGNGGLRLPNGVDCDFCVFNGDEDDLRRFARWSEADGVPTERELPAADPVDEPVQEPDGGESRWRATSEAVVDAVRDLVTKRAEEEK